MRRIDQDNYEAFYLDYLEGNLNEDETKQLFAFIDENPGLKQELEETDLILLDPETEIRIDKQGLKKSIDESNVEEYIIAAIENEIDPEDALELDRFLHSSIAAQSLTDQYQRTILTAPPVIYPHKNKLKRKSWLIYYIGPATTAIAAAIALFLLWRPTLPTKTSADQITQQSATYPYQMRAPSLGIQKENSASLPEKNNHEAAFSANQSHSPKDLATTKVHPGSSTRNVNSSPVNSLRKSKDLRITPIASIPEKKVQEKEVFTSPSEYSHYEYFKHLESDYYFHNNAIATNEPEKEERTQTQTEPTNGLLTTLVNKIDEKTATEIAYYHKEDEKGTSFGFSIGNFEFSRTKRR